MGRLFCYTLSARAIGATVSAGALHAQGWGFESLIAHHLIEKAPSDGGLSFLGPVQRDSNPPGCGAEETRERLPAQHARAAGPKRKRAAKWTLGEYPCAKNAKYEYCYLFDGSVFEVIKGKSDIRTTINSPVSQFTNYKTGHMWPNSSKNTYFICYKVSASTHICHFLHTAHPIHGKSIAKRVPDR